MRREAFLHEDARDVLVDVELLHEQLRSVFCSDSLFSSAPARS
jgi:hypothetical protein